MYRRATKRQISKKNIQHLSYTERLKYTGLPSLQYRRLRADMVETFKILNNIDKVGIYGIGSVRPNYTFTLIVGPFALIFKKYLNEHNKYCN